MILYANGDGFTSASYAVNDYAYANDDFTKVALGTNPHPDNLKISWGIHLADITKLALVTDAQHHASVDYIVRTTHRFINRLSELGHPYTLIVIGWGDPSIVEWKGEDGEWYQVSPNFETALPPDLQGRYRAFKRNFNHEEARANAHGKILNLHKDLESLGLTHLFFNSNYIPNPDFGVDVDWNKCYLLPYETSFYTWAKGQELLNQRDYCTPTAHTRWAGKLAQHIIQHF